MNGLMIAFAFVLPYHVLRTATAAGVKVHVLGNGASRGLRASRHCASYRELGCAGVPENAEAILDEIQDIVRRRRIDVIFPSDDVSTRLLAGMRDRLPVRASPMPDLATFDLLNDKGNFTRFCLDNGVRVPRGWLYDDTASLRAALASGDLDFPITAKPTNRSGGIGVLHIRDRSELGLIDLIDYRPILIQRHIVGETVGISVVCRDGNILAHAAQRRDDDRFHLFAHPDLLANTRKLVAATRLNGPANFDAILEEGTGDSYIVECNPRFWYTIFMSMIVGLNFMGFAVADGRPEAPGAATRVSDDLHLSLGRAVKRPWAASRLDWGLLRYHLGDPIVYLLYRAKMIDDSDVAVEVAQMSAYDWRGSTALVAPPRPAAAS